MSTLRTFSNISVYLSRLTLALIVASILATCSEKPGNESSAYLAAKQVAFDWNRLLLELERHTPGYRPPVSARMFAYVEMTGYEAALPAMLGKWIQ